MPYAVLQKNLEPPSIDQLKRAFRSVPGLTPADAHILGNDAFGILVKGFPLERATAMQNALATEGVETEIVSDENLPPLPEARFVHRVDCCPDALMIYDPLGRNFSVEWRHIMLIAAGRVCLTEFNRQRTERQVWRSTGRGGYYETVVDYDTKEARNDRLVLELVLSRAVLRYNITADKSAHLLFQYLGERRQAELLDNFTLLVRDVIQFAPHAAINRGAYYFRARAGQSLHYPSKNAFYEEIVWLLWRLANARQTA